MDVLFRFLAVFFVVMPLLTLAQTNSQRRFNEVNEEISKIEAYKAKGQSSPELNKLLQDLVTERDELKNSIKSTSSKMRKKDKKNTIKTAVEKNNKKISKKAESSAAATAISSPVVLKLEKEKTQKAETKAAAETQQPSWLQVSSNLAVVTDYVWRGQTQTSHGMATQGGIDFGLPWGFSVGTWVSNVSVGIEADFLLSWSYSLYDGVDVSFGGTHYHYPQSPTTDTFEYNIGLNLYKISLTSNFTDNYFGTKSGSWYNSISVPFMTIFDSVSGEVSFGVTDHAKEELVQSTDSSDVRISLFYSMKDYQTSLNYTDTNRSSFVGDVKTTTVDRVFYFAVSTEI